jgi:hypothetical protein
MAGPKLPKEATVIDDRSIAKPPYDEPEKGKVVPIDRAKEKRND